MKRGFQWDLARQIERLDVLLELLPRYADWGYNELYLHLEDAVEYPSLPFVARKDAYTHRQLARLVRAADKAGIGVVPIVNLLGHTQYLIKTPELRDLNELRDEEGKPLPSGQLCPLHPRTLDVADRLLGDMAPFCTTGKVHVGLDESFHLGKCPRCRAEIQRDGLAAHFGRHVQRLHTLTAARHLRLGLWADMLNFIPEAIPQLPADVIAYDWYYYPFKRHPRVELHNFRESDLATPLRARGIEYWGCPMNGAFRYEPLPLFRDRLANLRSWWSHCHRVGAAGMLVTSWEAYRLALETTTVVDAAASCFWRKPRLRSDTALLSHGFADVFKLSPAAARRNATAALKGDAYPFAGYARWEINERWDASAPLRDPKQAQKEERFFARQLRQESRWVEPLAASLRFRFYLAQRDRFVSAAAQGVFALRRAQARGNVRAAARLLAAMQTDAVAFSRAWKDGQDAAARMWRRTRRTGQHSQNAELLRLDGRRLQAWRAWLNACRADAELVWTSTPVCGAWQLRCEIRNFRPALQRVSIETLQPDGRWQEIHGRYTIEFQAAGAAPSTPRLRRTFGAPVENPASPLRAVLRGLGQVQLENLTLSNGVETRFLARRLVLGHPAPRTGFPDITRIQDTLVLC